MKARKLYGIFKIDIVKKIQPQNLKNSVKFKAATCVLRWV